MMIQVIVNSTDKFGEATTFVDEEDPESYAQWAATEYPDAIYTLVEIEVV